MGIDKLRLISNHFPCPWFVDEVNEDRSLPREVRKFDLQFRNHGENLLSYDTVCRITSRKGAEPGFFLQLNFQAFPGGGIRHILELNPNKLRHGWLDPPAALGKNFWSQVPRYEGLAY